MTMKMKLNQSPQSLSRAGSQRSVMMAFAACVARPTVVASASLRAPSAQSQDQQEQNVTSRRALLLGGVAAASSGLVLIPTAEAAVQATTANIELVRSMLNSQVAGNIDDVLKHQAKNVVWRLPVAYSGDPLGGEFQGKKGVLVYLTRQGAQTKDMVLKDLKLQESGRNEVIAQYRMSGKLKTNNKFSTSVTQVWRLNNDGLVASMVAYMDTASIAKAAGVKKSAD